MNTSLACYVKTDLKLRCAAQLHTCIALCDILPLQNVSDVLSCQAFLSMASAFPSPRYRRGMARLAAVTGETSLLLAEDCCNHECSSCPAGGEHCCQNGSTACCIEGAACRHSGGSSFCCCPADCKRGRGCKDSGSADQQQQQRYSADALGIGEDMVSVIVHCFLHCMLIVLSVSFCVVVRKPWVSGSRESFV